MIVNATGLKSAEAKEPGARRWRLRNERDTLGVLEPDPARPSMAVLNAGQRDRHVATIDHTQSTYDNPNVIDLMANKNMAVVINTPSGKAPREDEARIRHRMHAIRKGTETALTIAIALICILIPIGDFMGILDAIPWLSQRIPQMILIATGTMILYLVSLQATSLKSLEGLINRNHLAITSRINRDQSDQKIIDTIQSIWDRRESRIERIFDDASSASNLKSRETVINLLRKAEKSVSAGELFGQKLDHPWDIEISAIDYEGLRLYHRLSRLVSTKPRSPDHPVWEIMERRNGKLLWENFSSGKLCEAHGFAGGGNPRLTVIYFRDMPRVNLILLIESHINILPDLL